MESDSKKYLNIFNGHRTLLRNLEDFLTRVLGKKVDLVTKRALKPTVKDQILKDAIYV
jgi:predicted nucleotidyltransferase